ncbi:PhzF family phenazine biosynthesis protein [Aquimarina sp. 2201CG1-2-11]|uniref:PhzF family phenazine biosynthesis protein n=1 Tax=Aquimarina discodermiae TaxID=3231043 RepID=UPI003462627F
MNNLKVINVQVLNAFVEDDKGGNPAGVVLDADNLTHKNKLEIAKKVGLSETAFVSKSKTEDFKLEFFTPNRQIAHCGHATVATFSYLKQQNILKRNNSSKETIDGKRYIKLIDDNAFMEQVAPKHLNVSHKEQLILASLGLQKNDLLPNAPLQVVNTGNSFLLVPVKNEDVLKNITPNFKTISKISDEFDLIGFYVFTTAITIQKKDANSRMFAPRYHIIEEAATGMAAGPLACYLYNVLNIKKNRYLIRQGQYMDQPSPSLIIVDMQIKNNTIINLMVGGKGILKSKVSIEINS